MLLLSANRISDDVLFAQQKAHFTFLETVRALVCQSNVNESTMSVNERLDDWRLVAFLMANEKVKEAEYLLSHTKCADVVLIVCGCVFLLFLKGLYHSLNMFSLIYRFNNIYLTSDCPR